MAKILVTGASGGIGASVALCAMSQSLAVTFCALDAPGRLTGAILEVNGASYLRS